MQAPFWLPLWQAAESILSVATESAIVLPVMVLLCLLLGRRRQRAAMARACRLFLVLGFVTAGFGALAVAGQGFVSLIALPSAMESLTPLPFEPLSTPWLSTTTGFLAWISGIVLLTACWLFARPVLGTAIAEMDDRTAARMNRLALFAGLAALAAFFCYGASFVLRSWPFLGLPDQMTRDTVLQVLVKHTWTTSCAALMPAGALAVLTFFLQLPPVSAKLKREDRENRRSEVIPGTAEDLLPFSSEQKTTLRMCAAFALAGAAFQVMDASFLAFNPMAAMGSGLRAALMRFGPFLVSALSIVCWAFIFSRPRRHQLFLALLPVLLIFLRAAGGF
ncbi:MAG: hypothetical protein Q4F72_02380 [Desulfovibrionaceae bacterium]|nr:hypothetical protein [Desulfovibrionaceae bacterium]